MPKGKKLHFLLVILLLFIFAIGSIGIGILASRINIELQTSVIKAVKKAKKAKKRSAAKSRLLSQLVIAPEVAHGEEICDISWPENIEYKAEFINREVTVSADKGGEFEIALYLKNTGNVPWIGGTSGCTGANYLRLGTARDRDRSSIFYNPSHWAWEARNRIEMVEHRVNPGEVATFKFTSKAPRVTDVFREYFQPIVEAKQWIENKEALARADVYVGTNAYEYEKAAFYLNKSGQASSLDPNQELVIDIDLSEQKMFVKLGDTIIREYAVSSGTFNTPTPIGVFSILAKQDLRIGNKWPHYRMPYWQGFSPWGHGLHALPYLANDKGVFWEEALSHIGQRVSHGCVRLLDENAIDLYQIAQVGTKVVTHY